MANLRPHRHQGDVRDVAEPILTDAIASFLRLGQQIIPQGRTP